MFIGCYPTNWGQHIRYVFIFNPHTCYGLRFMAVVGVMTNTVSTNNLILSNLTVYLFIIIIIF